MKEFEDLEPTEIETSPVLAVSTPGRSQPTPEAIQEAMGRAFCTVMTFVQQHGLVPSGPPRAIYHSAGPDGLTFDVAMPVAAPPASPPTEGAVTLATLPGAKILRFTHRGPYRELMTTYQRIAQYLKAKGLMKTEADWARYMPMWEEYLNDPDSTPEADLRTHICLPLP